MSSLPGLEETEITVRTRQDGSLPVCGTLLRSPLSVTPPRGGDRGRQGGWALSTPGPVSTFSLTPRKVNCLFTEGKG